MGYQTSTPLHILLFGGTGRTGRQVITLALESGYAVTVIARNPAAVQVTHSLLTVIKGDILQPETFAGHMAGKGAVISCIGTDSGKPTKIYSQGVQHILKAMQAAGVKRIMCISADAVVINPKLPLLYKFVAKYILWRILKNPFTDLLLMEKILQHSNMDWTVVRPPQLTNKPFTGKYRVAINSYLDKCLRIRRANVAHFFVNNITNTATYKAIAEIAE